MSATFQNTRNKRPLLSIIMLGVLLVSVGIAWMVTREPQAARARTEDILDEIRSRKLSRWWGKKPVELWYIARDKDSKPIGWQRITRSFAAGGYAGTRQAHIRDLRISEKWTLNNDATAGVYIGQALTSREILQTRITLKNDEITVHSGLWNEPVKSSVPSNYIPEGLATLVFFLAASGHEDASCRMIFDADAVIPGRINFHSVKLLPEGSRRIRHVLTRGRYEMIYKFDSKGFIERIEYLNEGITYTRTSRNEISKHFEDMPGIDQFKDESF